jgi:hypothetical protein
MPPLIRSLAALRDVERSISSWHPKSGGGQRRGAGDSARHELAHRPSRGRPIEEMPPAIREWPIYRFDGRDAVILAAEHGREAVYL